MCILMSSRWGQGHPTELCPQEFLLQSGTKILLYSDLRVARKFSSYINLECSSLFWIVMYIAENCRHPPYCNTSAHMYRISYSYNESCSTMGLVVYLISFYFILFCTGGACITGDSSRTKLHASGQHKWLWKAPRWTLPICACTLH